MAASVKKTISLPRDLARAVDDMARADGRTFSAVVQDALRAAHAAYLQTELVALQDYWSRQARQRGILTEEDLERYLRS